MTTDSFHLHQVTSARDIDAHVRQALLECWVDVTNDGGAAGFPLPPIGTQQAAPALDTLIEGLAPHTSRLLTAWDGSELVGWLHLRRDSSPLTAHWGTVHHVQTHPSMRGRGIGAALTAHAHRVAAHEMGLEQLHLAARAGAGLETFYARLGWREIGRWPGALRLAPGDDRDEILMLLHL
ncbi:GNAT family N-acetyltransferase [Streptomyces sp. MNP-20]|uniref:GNAT family N-acetyltransferase n=1 Tax=Streptomyces sp. MNP-20 TaxID=2721165 RepID=UPI001552A54A|nr:GNAT family N-acetyltransferase [Streptomyces sp. MNP-20]